MRTTQQIPVNVPLKSRLPAAERRQQLLDVALHGFGANGFHSTSMNDIAMAAGVTKPVLYQHFSSKDELFAEVLAYAATDLRTRMEKALAEADTPHGQVVNGFAALVNILARDEAIYRVLFGDSTRSEPTRAAEVAATERSMALIIAAQLTSLSEDAGVRLMLGHSIVGMCEGALRHWYEDDFDLTPEELAAHLAELAWAGLRGTTPNR